MATTFTEKQLNLCSKEMLVQLLLSMQEQMGQMNRNMEILIEQLSIANQKRFSRSVEKFEIDGQLSMNDCINEAETIAAQSSAVEREMEEISPHSYKRCKQ